MAKYIPHGTTLTFNSKAVGGLINIGTPSRAKGSAETTDSASNFDRSFLPALRNGGEVAITVRHDPADIGQVELNTNYAANGSAAVVHCVITIPGSHTYTFDAFVITPLSGDLALVDDNAAVQSATLKVTGEVTISS